MSHTVHLKFEEIDNTVLQRLCGPLEENLEKLGKALEVEIGRRFAEFTFIGSHAHAARKALLKLAELAVILLASKSPGRLATLRAAGEIGRAHV